MDNTTLLIILIVVIIVWRLVRPGPLVLALPFLGQRG
jgi:hypothetical protein